MPLRHPRHRAGLVIALALVAAAAEPAAGQDWFRLRTYDGRTAPVTLGVTDLKPTLGSITTEPVENKDVYNATGLPIQVPDADPAGITSTIMVPATPGNIGVRVSVTMSHIYPKELRLILTAPDGSGYSLADHAVSAFVFNRNLPVPVGFPVQGAWKLTVIDDVGGDIGRLMSWSLTVVRPGGYALIDLTMSIESDAAGDDNGNTQGNFGSEKQDKWERIVQYFADGVYEQSEGAHRIRKVRIYTKGKNFGSADVRWGKLGHPHVPSNGGVGVPGGHVNMYETFKDGAGKGVNYDMLADESGSGYTLAHEWGHYFLGLYDEYVTEPGDVAVNPSIMSSQWDAERGDFRYLNFSIKATANGGLFQNTGFTWQHRAHLASGWETLARFANADPIDQASRKFQSLGKRIYYPELAGVAPSGTTAPRIDLPSAAARSALNIVWMRDRLNIEIILDVSGSMNGDPLNQAKAAARLLVDQLELGQARVGVTAFDHRVFNLLAILPIDSLTNRITAKNAIDSAGGAGETAIGDASAAALAKLLAVDAPNETKMAFLLSDGSNNSGRDPASVVPEYAAAGIPIFTFPFGELADPTTLSQMATGTGAPFFSSFQSLQVAQTFQSALQVAGSQPAIGSGVLKATAAASAVGTLDIDASIRRLQLTVLQPTFGVPAGTFVLADPAGSAATVTTTAVVGQETLLFFDIDQPAVGQWTLTVKPAPINSSFVYQATGLQGSVGYTISTGVRDSGAIVTSAGEIVIESTLSRRQPIANATVSATVVRQISSSNTTPVAMKDDGVFPDREAGDGTYTGAYIHTGRGVYIVDVGFSNPSGAARETYRGATVSAAVDGTRATAPADEPIAEAFRRSQSYQFSVETNVTVAAPVIATQPGNQSGSVGATLSFAVAASGIPSPSYQWQRKPSGAAAFTNLAAGAPYTGVTSNTLSVASITSVMAGDQFRCVVTNSEGTVTSDAASLGISGAAARPQALYFGAAKAGAAGAITSITPAQIVALSYTGQGAPVWTATADQPWLSVTGVSSTRFSIAVADAANTIGGSTSLTGTVTFTASNVNATVSVPITLLAYQSGSGAQPFGAFDTPVGGTTVQGSIAVTGWALDDVAVDRVEIWRDPAPGEPSAGVFNPGHPTHGKIFVGNTLFVEGARPDVEAAQPQTPIASRAGWGYLMLTWGLYNQGNGPFAIYAIAYDLDGHAVSLGSKAIAGDNANADRPFGAIDTPTYGGMVTGNFINFGWALTPGQTCIVQNGGVSVTIDSGPLAPVIHGDLRTDIAGLFPGFSNTTNGGGHLAIDIAGLADGLHTIAWLVTDSCGRSDGIGSRFFTVLRGSSVERTAPVTRHEVARSLVMTDRRELRVRLNEGDWRTVVPQDDGAILIGLGQTDRLQIALPGAASRGYEVVDGEARRLPVGSSLDGRRGIFYWQPAPGFLGEFELRFEAPIDGGTAVIPVRIIIKPRP